LSFETKYNDRDQYTQEIKFTEFGVNAANKDADIDANALTDTPEFQALRTFTTGEGNSNASID
jgi:hypothetical protein